MAQSVTYGFSYLVFYREHEPHRETEALQDRARCGIAGPPPSRMPLTFKPPEQRTKEKVWRSKTSRASYHSCRPPLFSASNMCLGGSCRTTQPCSLGTLQNGQEGGFVLSHKPARKALPSCPPAARSAVFPVQRCMLANARGDTASTTTQVGRDRGNTCSISRCSNAGRFSQQ